MPTMNFQQEQNEVFLYQLKEIEKVWKMTPEEKSNFNIKYNTHVDGFFLEVFLTPECNQSCQYCYLVKHRDQLYPPNIRNKETILKNFNAILEYARKNKLHIPKLDFFTGEIWGYPFGNKALDIVLNNLKEGLQLPNIMIPSNLSFCRDPKLMDIIQYYIDECKQYNCNLTFSCSMDGLYLDKINRPCNEKSVDFKTDEYYNNIFNFCKRNKYGYHPMISAATIEHQIKNYDTWIEKFKEVYEGERFARTFGSIMQLEVRDDDWTEDKIISYIQWLKHVIETDKQVYCNNDDELFYNTIFGLSKHKVPKQRTYTPYVFAETDHAPTCTAGKMISIRAGDLTVLPCHRTCYDKFNFGKILISEDNEFIGVEANNVPLMNAFLRTGNKLKPKCDNCVLHDYCLRGCYGAQYESSKEILFPCESVCDLFFAKNTFLIDYYEKRGVFSIPLFIEKKQKLLNDITNIKKTKEYQKWHEKLQQFI